MPQGLRLEGRLVPARLLSAASGRPLEVWVYVDGVLTAAVPAASLSGLSVPMTAGEHLVRLNLMLRGQSLHQQTTTLRMSDEEWIRARVAPAGGYRFVSRRRPVFGLTVAADADAAG